MSTQGRTKLWQWQLQRCPFLFPGWRLGIRRKRSDLILGHEIDPQDNMIDGSNSVKRPLCLVAQGGLRQPFRVKLLSLEDIKSPPVRLREWFVLLSIL